MHRAAGILAGVFLFLGMAVLLYNPLVTFIAQENMEKKIALFERSAEAPKASPSEQNEAAEEPYADLLAEMRRYNEELYRSGQAGLSDPWSCEQAAFDFSRYGLDTDVMGILRIPAMDQELPIYLGATQENMARGVAVLGQTSMPVGGTNTNCVIVGHRGYGSTPFLREIERLQPGDPVYLTTFWGEKTYRVESTAVILPTDLSAVLIQEGKEMLTLVTCHPYVEATHRYVVYCTAVPEEEAAAAGPRETLPAATEHGEEDASQKRIKLETWLPFLALPLILLAVAILRWPHSKKQGRQKRRKAENENKTP